MAWRAVAQGALVRLTPAAHRRLAAPDLRAGSGCSGPGRLKSNPACGWPLWRLGRSPKSDSGLAWPRRSRCAAKHWATCGNRISPGRSSRGVPSAAEKSTSGHELVLLHMLQSTSIKEQSLYCDITERPPYPRQTVVSQRADCALPCPAAHPARVPEATGLVVLGLVQPRTPQ